MKIKNVVLSNSVSVLNKLSEMDLDIVVACKLEENIIKFNENLQAYEKTRRKLIEKYADKDNEGKPIVKDNQYCFTDEKNKIKFIEEINKLDNLEKDLEFNLFKLDDFKGVRMTTLDYGRIKFMIEK